MQVAAGVANWDDCALTIYSTVVSRAGPDRGILDAGSKTLTSDTGGGLDGHGLILEHPRPGSRDLPRNMASSIWRAATPALTWATSCGSCPITSASSST